MLRYYARNTKARLIDCNFYGGPPGQQKMYAGTVLAMLIDRVCMTITDKAKLDQMLLTTKPEMGLAVLENVEKRVRVRV